MIRRSDVTVSDSLGTPEPGVYITVKDANGTIVALYNDDGTSLGNPLVSGTGGAFVYNVAQPGTYTEEYRLSLSDSPRTVRAVSLIGTSLSGLFINASALEPAPDTVFIQTTGYSALDVGSALYVYDAAVNAAYVTAHPRSSFLVADDRGFRLSEEQDLTPEMFGAIGNDSTDDHQAIEDGLSFVRTFARVIDSSRLASSSLLIPASSAYYVGTHTFELTETAGLVGFNSGLPDDFRSQLRWADGHTGIIIQRYNTSGATGTDGVTHTQGDCASVVGLCLDGGYTTISTSETDSHAIQLRARGDIRRCNFNNWGGNAVHGVADSGDATLRGNINGAIAETCSAYNCRNPFWFGAGDANKCRTSHFYSKGCRQSGGVDDAFLGNRHVETWVEACGVVPGSIPIWCSYSGNVYQVIWGQDAWCSTNAPSGTTADNTGWKYLYAGAADSGVNRPAWTSGLTWRAGGAFISTGMNMPVVFDNPYTESGQPAAQISQSTIVIAPQDGADIFGIPARGGLGPVVEPHLGALRIRGSVQVDATVAGKTLSSFLGELNKLSVIKFSHSDDTAGWPWRFQRAGADFTLDNADGARVAARLTGENTTYAIGPYLLAFETMGLGSGGGTRRITNGAAAPVAGAWAVGEIVYNNAPTAGGKIGWVCTTAGTPGTWKPFGAIDA